MIWFAEPGLAERSFCGRYLIEWDSRSLHVIDDWVELWFAEAKFDGQLLGIYTGDSARIEAQRCCHDHKANRQQAA